MLSLAHLSISLFLFYSRDHHQALHLFPTRRSSDLVLAGDGPAVFDAQVEDGAGDLLGPLGRTGFGVVEQHQDRKSTRLNSSHVAISYAVFCLKKKITV